MIYHILSAPAEKDISPDTKYGIKIPISVEEYTSPWNVSEDWKKRSENPETSPVVVARQLSYSIA